MKPWTVLASVIMASLAVGCASTQTQPTCAAATDRSSSADGLDKLSNEQLARKMLELTGSGKLGQQIMASMADSLQRLPGMPSGFMEKFQANAHPDDLVNLLVPIYVRNYDHETMIAAVRFYQSDSGRSLISHLPDVTRESAAAGKGWGRALAQKTLKDMGLPPSP